MQGITVYLLLLGAAAAVQLRDRDFRCDYKYFEEANGWLKFHTVPATWHEARLRCQFEGSELASPLNVGIESAMKTLMNQDPDMKCGVFTGIHATFSKGDFFSVDEVPLRKIPHKWAKGEPDNFNNTESCILKTPKGELADVSCEDTFPYMCYKKASEVKALTECGTEDPAYTLDSRTGKCYKFHRIPRIWSRAYMVCANEGGSLTIINNDTEAQILKEIFNKNPGHLISGNVQKGYAFIGVFDWNEHGQYLTIEGKTLEEAGYAKFGSSEPNHMLTGEYCIAIDRYGYLLDISCETYLAFICEKSPDSLLCENDDAKP